MGSSIAWAGAQSALRSATAAISEHSLVGRDARLLGSIAGEAYNLIACLVLTISVEKSC